MKLDKYITAVNDHFPPRAWDRVTIKMIAEIKSRGISVSAFNEELEIDDQIVNQINDCLFKMYGKGLPANI